MFGKQNLPLVYGLDLSQKPKRSGFKLSLSLALLCAILVASVPQAWALTGDTPTDESDLPSADSSAISGSTTSFLLSLGVDSQTSEVTANQPFSLTVTAIDDSLNTVPDYAGTVTFTSSDSGATLPEDYTFTSTDLGEKTFDLGFSLLSSGDQTVTVTDSADELVFGEITLTVTGTTSTNASTDQPMILTPSSGEVLNTAIVDIVGTAPASSTVTIYDGTIVKGTATADAQGAFSYTTDALFDGTHTFVAEVDVNGQKVRSSEVQVTVDTTAPVIQHLTLTPPNPAPGAKVDVTVETEGELSALKLVVDQRNVTLSEGGVAGTYTGSFIAPSAAGEYTVDVEVTDKAGNTDTYQDQATLTVGGTTTAGSAPTAVASADLTTGLAPLTVNFTGVGSDADGQVASYSWNFGDGSPALTGETANHTYVNPGVYTATLTVTDNAGLTNTSTVAITVSNGVTTPPPQTAENGPGAWALTIVAALALSYCWNRKAFHQLN